MLAYNATPVQVLHHPLFDQQRLRVIIKREDLNHPFVSGNKWWKLKYNLEEAKRLDYRTILTFGGAHSNHIYATAAAAKEAGLKAFGVIRGDELTAEANNTLQFARDQGIELYFITRERYRQKEERAFADELKEIFGDFYLIPEGGTNELAIQGVQDFALQLAREADFDYLCCAVGTGGTLAGLIKALPDKKIIGFSSLKGSFLEKEVAKWPGIERGNWLINHDYHFGGYGKVTPDLLNFMLNAEKDFNLPLEQVYTAKMLYGVMDLIKREFFLPGSSIMLLHTGGLQGRILA